MKTITKSRLALVVATWMTGLITNSYADCSFNVVNYSNSIIYARVGFFDDAKSQQVVKVSPARNQVVIIKSTHDCEASNGSSDIGLAFVDLINGQSSGGWRYRVQANTIYAKGGSILGQTNANGTSPLGHSLTLDNNYKPTHDEFEVTVEAASRNQSRISSMR